MTRKNLSPIAQLVPAIIRHAHRARCLIHGCYYGVTAENACVYCGVPRPNNAKIMGRSPIEALGSYAAALGKKGGRATSEAKKQAARTNGKKGGRPRNTADA